MPQRNRIFWLTAFLLCCTIGARAGGLNTITLRATRTTILADGKQSTQLIAEVRDSSGRPITGSAEVDFQTTAGTLSSSRVQAFSGYAQARLTSAPIAGVAHITAVTPGAVGVTIDVLFTDDPEATFAGNQYVQVVGNSYLAYSTTDKVIEAQGKNGGARLTYRNVDITADRLQLRTEDLILRAHDNIVMKRGGTVLHATRLFYSLQSAQGYAIAEHEGRLEVVLLSGENLQIKRSPTPIPNSYINFVPLQVKLVVVARGINYFPNERLQFRRPKFFQDQRQIMALPYYEMPLNSQELFSDQFFSLGTSGFGLELPFYYNLTPHSTGILYLRHQEQISRSYFSTEPGWSVDLAQSYSNQGEERSEGSYAFTGLTRDNWGFRWNHNQDFGGLTQGSVYLDFPQHDGVTSTINLTQQQHTFRWGGSVTGSQTFISPSASNVTNDFYVETLPHKLADMKDLMYTIGTTFDTENLHTSDTTVGNFNRTAEGVNMKAFTRQIVLDPHTSLTNSVTLGEVWASNGTQGLSALATVAMSHTFKGGGNMNLSYDLVNDPTGFITSTGHNRVSITYAYAANRHLSANFFGSAFLDASDSSLLGDLIYRLNRNWRLLLGVTLQRFEGASYNDLEFTVGRKIGAREIELTYSTLNKRISLDLTATSF